jgi:hypothetical protein
MNAASPDSAFVFDPATAIDTAGKNGYLDLGDFTGFPERAAVDAVVNTWVARCRANGRAAPFLGLAGTAVWFVAVTMPETPSEAEIDRLHELMTVEGRPPMLDVPDVTTWHTSGIDSYAEAVEVARRVADWSGTPANRRWAVAKEFC